MRGCTPKHLQSPRYLITMFHRLNCYQVTKPVQSFRGAASKCSALGAQPPRFSLFEDWKSPSCSKLKSAAFWDAKGYGKLEPSRANHVFSAGSFIGLLLQIVPHGRFCFDHLHTIPKMETWISLRGYSLPDPSASQKAALCGPVAAWGAAPPKQFCILGAALDNQCFTL